MKRYYILFLYIILCNALSEASGIIVEPQNNPESSPQTDLQTASSPDSVTPRLRLLDPEDRIPVNTENTPTSKEEENTRNWWKLFKQGKLNLSDTTVEYPKFLGFCVKVYNWGDRVFNSYDTTYVVGTGKRWKARLAGDSWADSYYFNIDRKMPMRMISDLYNNAAIYLQYMAVSYGYSLDLTHVIGNKPANHKKMDYNFNCSRFNIEAHYWENSGGTIMRTFGSYNEGKLIREEFPGVFYKAIGLNGYFFFNNRKYSMGAAYNFSRIQKKSAGSAIIGFNYNNLDVTMDLHRLPDNLKPYLNIDPMRYKFHYNTYALMSGYSYNWVWNKHMLFNISAFPGLGYTFTYEDSTDSKSRLFSMVMKGQTSLTYNLKDFFVCLIGKLDGNWYRSSDLTLFSSVENIQLSVGIRF